MVTRFMVGWLTCLGLLGGSSLAVAQNQAKKATPFQVKLVGKGRPMILIPGLACSGDVWDSTVEHFKDRYECHVLTLAGFAGQPPVEGPFLDTVRTAIAEYIRAKKLDKPVVVGHSLGGFLVFALGASEPELVGPLVAVDGLPCLPAVYNEKVDAETMKKQATAIEQGMAKAPREQYLKNQEMILQNWIKDKKHLETVKKWGTDSDQATVARAMADLFSKDLRGEVARIKSPVLLLGAFTKEMEMYGLNRKTITERYTAQVAKIPQHEVAVAEDSRHFIMYDAPQWMFAQMDKFLAGK
jgi:pimeloyl-ACP methyl ester carboxylesterase